MMMLNTDKIVASGPHIKDEISGDVCDVQSYVPLIPNSHPTTFSSMGIIRSMRFRPIQSDISSSNGSKAGDKKLSKMGRAYVVFRTATKCTLAVTAGVIAYSTAPANAKRDPDRPTHPPESIKDSITK